ncbi:transposase [Streptomyces avermitilis]|uniref:transposase n=1 Tax=Streptomyces avermitilis TaxID=33903 RepID=UPI00131CDEA3|nr:transposase [Streptomyces sp. SID5469]
MDDDLWALIEPLLPPWPKRSSGPRPVDDRLCLQGFLYALHQDIAWQLLPLELELELELELGSGRADLLAAPGRAASTTGSATAKTPRCTSSRPLPTSTTSRTPRPLPLVGLPPHLLETPQEVRIMIALRA